MASHKLSLLTDEDNFRVQKLRIAAAIVGVKLPVKVVSGKEKSAAESSTPQRTLPVLQTPSGALAQSNAILRYLASLREDEGLVPFTSFEAAQVEEWLEVSCSTFDPLVTLLSSTSGEKAYAAAKDRAKVDLPAHIARLDAHLATRTFVVGEGITLADIALAAALAAVWHAHVAPIATRHQHVTRWYMTIRHHPRVLSVLGAPLLSSGATSGAAAQPTPTPSTAACSSSGAGTVSSASAAVTAGQILPSALTAKDTFLPTEKFRRSRQRIGDVLVRGADLIGTSIVVCGWARTVREAAAGSLAFIALNDGTAFDSLQVVAERGKTIGFEAIAGAGGTHASFRVVGNVVKSPAKGQAIELVATEVEVLGGIADPATYPLSKKRHTIEYLREIQHLRPRTNLIGAVERIRNACAFATHKFFQDRGFLYVHTPIITGSDCEVSLCTHMYVCVCVCYVYMFVCVRVNERARVGAFVRALVRKLITTATHLDLLVNHGCAFNSHLQGAGEMFQVTTIVPDNPAGDMPRTKDKKIDYSKDFFSKPAFMTVSGQLQVEAYATAMSDCYTFGPTFRAEMSYTSRHLAEFWMIEPEIA